MAWPWELLQLSSGFGAGVLGGRQYHFPAVSDGSEWGPDANRAHQQTNQETEWWIWPIGWLHWETEFPSYPQWGELLIDGPRDFNTEWSQLDREG